MGIDEIDFNWRLNWWYRPTHDGFGTVADYYEYFCDWKANMELNSCPAEESDYIDAFIQNLKCDIRLRIESKGRLSMRSLRDVFIDAQFMESLITMEDALKKIAAKFEAHDPFDKMPDQAPADNFEDKMHPNSDYTAELQETDDVSLEKTDDGTDTPGSAEIKEEAVIELDEMTDSSLTGLSSFSSPVVIEDSAYSLALEALIWMFEEDEESPPSMLEDAGPVLHGFEVGQSQFLTVRSVKDGRHLLDEMPQLVLTSLQSIPEDLKPLFLGESCNSAIKLVALNVACKVFVEMQPNEETSVSYIPPVDCVPQVFDPGSVDYMLHGFETAAHVGWRFYPVSTRFHMFDKMPKQISLDQTKGKSAKVFMLIFDPGGHLSYHNGCSFFKPIHFNTFDKMLNQLSKNFQLEQEYCDLSNMKIVELNETQEVVFIFDPGGHSVCYMVCSSLRPIGKKNCALCDFWADELTSAAFQLCVPDPCSRVSSLHQTGYASRHSLEPRKINGNAIMTIFDPGGILVYYNGCDPFAEHRQNDMIWSFHSNSRNDGAEIWCFWGSFQHCVGAYLLHLSTVLMINMSMIEFSYNHCCWTIYKIYEHYLEPRQQFVGNFRIGMLAGSCHFPEGRFPGGYKNVVLLMAIILESFVWDPGLRATFFSPVTCSAGVIFVRILLLYILGDKDDFEGKGR